MLKVLITGHNGYIASSLESYFKNTYDLTLVGRKDVDLTDSASVNAWFKDKMFDVIIHTAIRGGHRLHEDDSSIFQANLKMYYNILNNREKYGRLINIGSGAEVYDVKSPYGHSKIIIGDSVMGQHNCYNIRAYGIFDENEINTRFIKSNVTNYINKRNLTLYQNKKMDLFYMGDFVTLLKHYIHTESVPKEIDCTYATTHYLSDILDTINSLSNYKVSIVKYDESIHSDYTGIHQELNLPYLGLYKGIEIVYEKLLCKK